MATQLTSFPSDAARFVRPKYRSRLRIIIAKELGDIFLRSRIGLILLIISATVVPAIFLINGVMSASFGPDPYVGDRDMRNDFPSLLLMFTLFGPAATGGIFAIADTVSETIAPLLATGARRYELVAGKFLAFSAVWAGYSAVVIGELALAKQVPAIVNWYPALRYFHPTPAFFTQLFLVLTLGGCCAESIIVTPIISTVPTRTRLVLAAIMVCAIAGWRFPLLWPLLGLVPVFSTPAGVKSVFAQLAYDDRVPQNYRFPVDSHLAHHHFWIAVCAGSAITTLVMLAVNIRSLDRGDHLVDTAK